MATDVRTYPEWRPTRPWRDWLPERNARLHRFVNEQLYPYSPFYRQFFDANKIDPHSIRTVDDLRRIPFTTKRDIAPTAENATRHLDFVLHPDLEKFRRFAPKTKLAGLLWTKLIAGDAAATRKVLLEYGPVHVIFTTGRTALPTQFVYAPPDMDRLYVVGKRLAEVVGITPEDRSLNVFPFAPHLAFWQAYAVGQASATLVLHTGGGKVMGTAGNVLALQRMQPNVIIGVPGYRLPHAASGAEQRCAIGEIETHLSRRRARAAAAQGSPRRDLRADGPAGSTRAERVGIHRIASVLGGMHTAQSRHNIRIPHVSRFRSVRVHRPRDRRARRPRRARRDRVFHFDRARFVRPALSYRRHRGRRNRVRPVSGMRAHHTARIYESFASFRHHRIPVDEDTRHNGRLE
jgi:hypothetical protein